MCRQSIGRIERENAEALLSLLRHPPLELPPAEVRACSLMLLARFVSMELRTPLRKHAPPYHGIMIYEIRWWLFELISLCHTGSQAKEEQEVGFIHKDIMTSASVMAEQICLASDTPPKLGVAAVSFLGCACPGRPLVLFPANLQHKITLLSAHKLRM